MVSHLISPRNQIRADTVIKRRKPCHLCWNMTRPNCALNTNAWSFIAQFKEATKQPGWGGRRSLPRCSGSSKTLRRRSPARKRRERVSNDSSVPHKQTVDAPERTQERSWNIWRRSGRSRPRQGWRRTACRWYPGGAAGPAWPSPLSCRVDRRDGRVDPSVRTLATVPVLDSLWGGGGAQFGHQDPHDVEEEDEVNLRVRADQESQERLKFNLNSATAELLHVYGLHNLNPDRKKYTIVIHSNLH